MQAVGLWSGISQTTQLLQSVVGSVHSARLQPSKIINLQQPSEPSTSTRNYVAEILQFARPSLNHSRVLRTSNRAIPTAQDILSHLPRRPIIHHTSSILIQRRQISTSPWKTLTRYTPEKIGNPFTYARVVRLDAEANAHPNNVLTQVKLWEAILELDTPHACQKIIDRWERLLEFAPHSKIIASDAAFKLYLRALVKAGHGDSVMIAASRREQVLRTVAAAPVETPAPEADQSEAEAAPQSPSHDIAEEILSDQTVNAGSTWTAKLREMSGSRSPSAPLLAGGTKQQPLHVYVEQPKGSVAWQIGKTLLIVGLYGFITLTILGLVLENSGLLKTNTQVTEFEQDQAQPVKFSDVHGVDEAKEELADIVAFLKNPATFSALGGKLPKGVLLDGPPGTGKTLLARAVAGEAGVPFFFASGSDFEEIFVGVGAKRVRELFAAARKKQPAIIFIDELDAVGGKRSPKDQQFMKQTLNQLLVELDGFKQSEGVIVIGATNFAQSLDKALVRPGRFDRRVVVPLPDVRGRTQILKHHMKSVINDPGVDVATLARATPGFSGADIQNMVNQAAIQASKEGSRTVTDKHYEWARDKINMGPERRSAVIEDKVKLATSYHEGGHALAAMFTKGAMPLYKITCMPRGHALGVTHQIPEGERVSVSFTEYLAELDVCTAGRAAEEFIYGKENITSGAASDLVHASHVARNMVRRWGFSDKIGPVVYSDDEAAMLSPQKKDEIEAEVKRLVEESYARTSKLLKQKENELHRLAKAVYEYETLNAEEAWKVIKGEKIRAGEKLIDA